MQDGETTAEAEGNAAALLYATVTESPDDTPFETQMTPEMIENHKYYNDDILEIAERMADKLEELDLAREDLARIDANIARLTDEGVVMRPGGNMARARLYAESTVKTCEAAIAMFEQQIEDEIEEVRTEYRRLAENLNSRAEMYRGDYEALQRFRQDKLREATEQRQELIDEGADPDAAARAWPIRTEDGYYSHYVKQYEVTWGDYRLLQEGFAITTTREAIMGFVWGAAELIALEIITAGLVTYAAGAVMATRLGSKVVGAAIRASDNVLALLIKRYNDLPPRVRSKLDEIFDRIKHGDDRPDGPEGVTGRADDAPRATPGCAARGAAFC